MTALFNRLLLASWPLTLTWVLMAGSLHWQELLTGALVAVAVAYLSLHRLHILDGLLPSLALPWHRLHDLLIFLHDLIESNSNMTRRVMSADSTTLSLGTSHCLCRQPRLRRRSRRDER